MQVAFLLLDFEIAEMILLEKRRHAGPCGTTCFPFCPPSLAQCVTDPNIYLLTWSTWRWWPRAHQINFWCYLRGHHFLFVVEPSVTVSTCHYRTWHMSSLDRLHVCPTLLTELGRSHVKKIHINNNFVQHRGDISPHQPRYHDVAGWFNVTIEPDANR
jgi:hypothetical protein